MRKAAAELLARKALEAGIERFADVDALDGFMARVEFAGFRVAGRSAGAL